MSEWLGAAWFEYWVFLTNLFEEKQIEEYRKHGFDNIIYQIQEGEFDEFIQKIGGGVCDYLKLKHYIIITLNFVVEIIAKCEPSISIMDN